MISELLSMFSTWESKIRVPNAMCHITTSSNLCYKLITVMVGLIVTINLAFIVADVLMVTSSGVFLLTKDTHFVLLLMGMAAHLVIGVIHILYKRDLMIFKIKKDA
ncbi:hypothetical protein [Alishewanella phage vB_AspM_Slickus01]|nr:hypothetical protein [Alishewanella phage vB_AspM_Slickus01]